MKKWKIVVLLLISILSISMIIYKKNLKVQKNEQKVKWERYDAGSIKELHYLDKEKRVISFRASKNFITFSGWAYMLFTIALAGLRKLMYAEASEDTFLNKIAKMISLYGMAILGIGIIIKHILGIFSLDVSTSIKAFGFLLLWIFCNIVVLAISAFIGLPYFLQAYYKWKYPEEYRSWEGKSVEEWYGKQYLNKHEELLKNG